MFWVGGLRVEAKVEKKMGSLGKNKLVAEEQIIRVAILKFHKKLRIIVKITESICGCSIESWAVAGGS